MDAKLTYAFMTNRKELINMKITIELNEEELKGLIFGKEKPKDQPDARFMWYLLYKNRYIADSILEDMKEVARSYGFVRVSDFKELSNKYTHVNIAVYYLDENQGWTLEMLNAKARIVRMRNGYDLKLPKPLFIE